MARATVGVLFSDIEGSTRLLQELGPAYGEVLLEHRRLLRSAFAEHEGTDRGSEGDSFFVTFPTARAAIDASLAAQRALHDHVWPHPGTRVRVRMGIHVGEVEELGEAVVGLVVHETARIAAAGHGGQVLVSDSAVRLGVPAPVGVGWRDLGDHRLKDVPEPLHLYQLTHPRLPDSFPPLRLQGTVRTNLPQQASSFLGREAELEQVRSLLSESRLVTVTGTGGVGKTRIALRVAADQLDQFTDGVFLVDLAEVSEPGSVVAQVIASLNLPVTSADLASSLAARQLLLVLDNCEHLLGDVAAVAEDLLRHTAGVCLLATSREPLGVTGEVVWRVPPLTPGDARDLLTARARGVNADFAVTAANQDAVDEVCRRLDSIPLALELAGARLASLSVEQVAERLDQRFRLLGGGSRAALERHRTLQATVDWSYHHLDTGEQALLRRLGVFTGSFPLAGAEAVSGADDRLAVLETLHQLVLKSMVVAESGGGATRYRLLETIRQYSLDRLAQAGDALEARDAHLEWAVQVAGQAETALWLGGDEAAWLVRLDDEQGNLRSALEWARGVDLRSKSVAILFAVFPWFTARGRSREGLDLCRSLLADGLDGAELGMAHVLELCFVSNIGAIPAEIISAVRQTVHLLRESDRPWLAPMTEAYVAAWSYPAGDAAGAVAAIPACEEAVAEMRGYGPQALSLGLQPLVWVNLDAGRFDAARAHADEGLAAAASSGASFLESRMALNRARVDVAAGDSDAAWEHGQRALAAARATGDTFVAIVATRLLAEVAEERAEPTTAQDLLASIIDAVADTQPAQLEGVMTDLQRCRDKASDAGASDAGSELV